MIARDFQKKQGTCLLRCIPFLLHSKVLSNTLSNQTEKKTRRNQVIFPHVLRFHKLVDSIIHFIVFDRYGGHFIH